MDSKDKLINDLEQFIKTGKVEFNNQAMTYNFDIYKVLSIKEYRVLVHSWSLLPYARKNTVAVFEDHMKTSTLYQAGQLELRKVFAQYIITSIKE